MKNRPLCSVCLILLLAAVIRVVVGGERLVLELRPSALECLVRDKEAITAYPDRRKKQWSDADADR